jgi:hypothetical protein
VKIVGTGLANTPVTVDWALDDLVVSTSQVTLNQGRGDAVLDFLRWWEEGGGVNWQNNSKAARAAKAIRPDVSTWTDAVQSQGQYKELDAGGSWSYSTDPTVIWTMRGRGCSPTPGLPTSMISSRFAAIPR